MGGEWLVELHYKLMEDVHVIFPCLVAWEHINALLVAIVYASVLFVVWEAATQRTVNISCHHYAH